MSFQVGDILKFSEKGLMVWARGKAPPDDPRRQWRWKVIEVGSPSVFLTRVDGLAKDNDWWSPYFFEKVEQ